MDEETIDYSICQCPKWFSQRGRFFDSFFLGVTVDRNTRHIGQNVSPSVEKSKSLTFTLMHIQTFYRVKRRAFILYNTFRELYPLKLGDIES